ncbi:hypothetical protein AB4351_21130 [Vibrio sp. 10N.261.51.F11]|uniref:hypothetical protein n=1 Tax=Vibrio sp. 10N.261.51.F11 TaxID=3229678 RepID=UPI003553A045
MNNFAVDTVGMTGADVGVLQSVREIPGLLSFTVLFLLFIASEQRVAVLSVATLGLGVAMTGICLRFMASISARRSCLSVSII